MNSAEAEPLRVVELFAGIGAQVSALERLGLDHERVAVAEIDESVYRVYCALHGDTPNLGDITKIEHLPECDLLTYSSPCQDISIAGHKAGLKKGSGTRSATLWDVGRLLEDMKEREILPEVLLMENVDSILFKHAIADFNEWVAFLDSLGYTNSYTVLNAKDHGVPQNRKRMFMVSTLHMGKFVFPEPRPLTLRLKDVLETDVDEKFYLSEERIAAYERKRQEDNGRIDTPKSDGQGKPGQTDPSIEEPRIRLAGDLHKDGYLDIMNRVYGADGIAPTINTCSGGGRVPKIEVVGNLNNGSIQNGLVYGTDGLSPCLMASAGEKNNLVRIEVTDQTANRGGGEPMIEPTGFIGKRTQHNTVYSSNGIAPTLAACDYKDPTKIEVDPHD